MKTDSFTSSLPKKKNVSEYLKGHCFAKPKEFFIQGNFHVKIPSNISKPK